MNTTEVSRLALRVEQRVVPRLLRYAGSPDGRRPLNLQRRRDSFTNNVMRIRRFQDTYR